MIKQLSSLFIAALLSSAISFAQCPDLPAARLIQPSGNCNGTGSMALASGPDYAVPQMISPQSACAYDAYIDNFTFNTYNNNASGCSSNSSNFTFYRTPA